MSPLFHLTGSACAHVFSRRASVKAAVAVMMAVALFWLQSLAVAHSHELNQGEHDHEPQHRVCQLCIVATSEDEALESEGLAPDKAPELDWTPKSASISILSEIAPVLVRDRDRHVQARSDDAISVLSIGDKRADSVRAPPVDL